MKTVKLISILGLSAFGVALAVGASTTAAYTNYSFGVPQTTKSSKPNNKDYDAAEMVSHPDRPFTTALTHSEEGNGTIMTMWMELQNATVNTSNGVNVKQYDTPVYYNAAHKGAGLTKGTWHNITAENNNFNAAARLISGTWSADSSY
ncbi:DUF2712 domain-containing protein [Lacticaseibacillus jixiensis]|uniref:DUF2712 domain-containing protein n=1 Tax=Lacticaseibacillus jixiensis TaxID=3231926 RepID=UPI0036F2415D